MNNTEKTALIIGGGVAGMEAAIKIGNAGYQVLIVEKEPKLGGVMSKLYSSFPRWENPQELVDDKAKKIEECSNIKTMLSTVVTSAERKGKSFTVNLDHAGVAEQAEVDAVVLAMGFELFDAAEYGEYGYGAFDNVYNSLEFEDQLKAMAGKDKSELPQVVAFFKCVGSRDRSKGFPYCSKICCMYTAKQAGLMKDINPDAKCFVFYMDYRATGKEYEEFVRSVIEDKHVRYVRGRPAKVLPENGKLVIRAEDTLMGVPVEVAADMIVLASAIVPSATSRELAEMFTAKTDQYGFIEYDSKNPVQAGDRVFFAGACGFAVESLGAQHQGAAAAADVVALFNQD
ncbi:cob--com heterodisulfide reductase subunit a [hydrocarbon metagenome]|uniref:Cob--com heterodisulfide reductase subunit a n=1 Tax=hydrocarbon metagenome TaxID=938273 RepID=A0A0W8E6P1_9ZZZZ